MNKLKNSKLYYCYSVPLRNFLSENGIRYELCAKNLNSNILMWIYVRTDNLNQQSTKWSLENKN